MLLSHRHPLLYKLAVAAHRTRRHLRWFRDNSPLARQRPEIKIQHNVKKHTSRLLKQLNEADMRLQHNKVTNLKVCQPLVDGLTLLPGDTFSFCRIIGKPTLQRGFVPGMELSMGIAQEGVGGGICQLANMLHWLVLHSPLTVTERSTHSFDPFPDSKRSIPFGTGCAVFFNYIDFAFRNDTDYTFKLKINLTDKDLVGQLLSDRPIEHTYKIYEKDHRFEQRGDQYFRHNEIWRHVMLRTLGHTVRHEHIKTNDVRVLYTPTPKQLQSSALD